MTYRGKQAHLCESRETHYAFPCKLQLAITKEEYFTYITFINTFWLVITESV